jgi:hypothetical protein
VASLRGGRCPSGSVRRFVSPPCVLASPLRGVGQSALPRPIGSATSAGPCAWCLRGLAASAVASSLTGGFTARRTVPFGQRPPLRFATPASWPRRFAASASPRCRGRLDRPRQLGLALGASAAWPLRQSRRVPWGLSLRNGRDPGFVAARHWLGGGVRYSGWKSSKRLTGGSDTRSRVPGHRGSVGFLVGVMECCARTVSCVGGGWR